MVRNSAAFTQRYGNAVQVAGEFEGNTALQDNGERITLLTGAGSTVTSFNYGDSWHEGWVQRADGAGSSLQVIDTAGDYNEPTNWTSSRAIHGSPGAAADLAGSGVVINEVLSRSVDPVTDQIELYNPNQHGCVAH